MSNYWIISLSSSSIVSLYITCLVSQIYCLSWLVSYLPLLSYCLQRFLHVPPAYVFYFLFGDFFMFSAGLHILPYIFLINEMNFRVKKLEVTLNIMRVTIFFVFLFFSITFLFSFFFPFILYYSSFKHFYFFCVTLQPSSLL